MRGGDLALRRWLVRGCRGVCLGSLRLRTFRGAGVVVIWAWLRECVGRWREQQRETTMVESLILAQDQRWRRA